LLPANIGLSRAKMTDIIGKITGNTVPSFTMSQLDEVFFYYFTACENRVPRPLSVCVCVWGGGSEGTSYPGLDSGGPETDSTDSIPKNL